MEVSKGPALFPTGLMLSLGLPSVQVGLRAPTVAVHRNPRDDVKRGSWAPAVRSVLDPKGDRW